MDRSDWVVLTTETFALDQYCRTPKSIKIDPNENVQIMRAVQRIVAIFESFTSGRSSLTLQEIADRIELPKSTAFRIVQSLEHEGYLVRLEDQKYCLSFRFTRLAGLVKSTLSIREIARPIMGELADKTKETVCIHTVSGRNRVCIDAVATASPLRSVTQPGEQVPLIAGSSSKTLAAHMPSKELAPIVTQMARTTKRRHSEVLAELTRIRHQGYAVSNGEHVLGVSSISAPIRGVDEQMHYCLSVVGPTVRVQMHEKEFVKLVTRAATDISRRYGFKFDDAVLNVD